MLSRHMILDDAWATRTADGQPSDTNWVLHFAIKLMKTESYDSPLWNVLTKILATTRKYACTGGWKETSSIAMRAWDEVAIAVYAPILAELEKDLEHWYIPKDKTAER